jgi:hypothetical protein
MEMNEGKYNIGETVRSIREAMAELRRAVKSERAVCSPILKDYSLLPELYGMFCDLIGKQEAITVDDRKVFLFIVQYMYAPRNLFGTKMPARLRREIARTLHVNAESVVSRWSSETMHHYQVYTQFRSEVNRIFGEIVGRLQESGLLQKPG